MTSLARIVTIITDFGCRDTYVGQMKGVIVGINPATTLIDLTHDVQPQNKLEAAFHLSAAAEAFPPATVHLIVVDPGVGTTRRIIVAEADAMRVVCPDNGIVTPLLQRGKLQRVVHVKNEAWFRSPVSNVFHGRDIMAPVAAHLCNGIELSEFGPDLPADDLVRLPEYDVIRRTTADEGRVILASVIHIDRFGNAVTSLHRDDVSGEPSQIRLVGGDHPPIPLVTHYAAGTSQQLVALFGSGQRLELAVPNGNAAEEFGIAVGDAVEWCEHSAAD